MASHRSAAKRARQTIKRTERNTGRLTRVRTLIKAFRTALTGTDKTIVESTFLAATRELRKAASAGILHRNNASRRVARLAAAHQAVASK